MPLSAWSQQTPSKQIVLSEVEITYQHTSNVNKIDVVLFKMLSLLILLCYCLTLKNNWYCTNKGSLPT